MNETKLTKEQRTLFMNMLHTAKRVLNAPQKDESLAEIKRLRIDFGIIILEVHDMVYPSLEEIAAKKLLKEESDPGYEYEIFIDDKGSPFEINDWIPIANEMIKDITKIDEYIKKGLLRRMKVSK